MPTKHTLTLPLENKSQLDSIQVGDIVSLDGIIITSRDMAHKFYVENINSNDDVINKLHDFLKMGAIYHCGPIVNLENNKIISAGPTTSIREEPYQKEVIKLFNLSFVIGKGGMGQKTLEGLKTSKALYLNAIGGAGSFYANNLKVLDVFKLNEFGMPEAIWVLKVKNLFTIATMDFRGKSIYNDIDKMSKSKLKKLLL